jgi:hypothetical protein
VTTTSADAAAAIVRQRRVFLRLVQCGLAELNAGRAETAAGYAQIAAHYAWHNHPGLFASPSLERLLSRVADDLPKHEDERTTGPTGRMCVLHVMTTAYPVGGHTRLVWRWIRNDRGRRHSVLLTAQRGTRPSGPPLEVPAALAKAVANSGGELVVMDDRREGFVRRAAQLRRLAAAFDAIVLHIHPYDAIPIVAFGSDGRPPTIFVNHAEHVFWLGASVGDVVAHLRQESASMSEHHRGIERSRSFILPLPLGVHDNRWSRDDAKRSLGIPSRSVVLVTVGSPYKYRTREPPHFAEVVLPILERHKDAVLVAVGPSGGDGWEDARRKSGGRVLTVGHQEDIDRFVAAADVYLDSFPIGSLTAVLDAALRGVPAVQCRLPRPTLLPTSDPALEGHLIRENLGSYADGVSALVEDEPTRRSLGMDAREHILQLHTGAGWVALVDELFDVAARAPRARRIVDLDEGRPVEAVDEWVQWMNETTGQSRDFSEAQMIVHARFMPHDCRLVLAARTRRLRKLVPPLDIRTRGHLERPRRYVAGDPVFPADWPDFCRVAVRAAQTQTRSLVRNVSRRALRRELEAASDS